MSLRLDLMPFPEGVHHVVLEPEAQDLNLDSDLFKDIEVEVVLDVHNDRVFVTLKAMALATLQCDRTAVMFNQDIEGSYRILFASPSIARNHDGEAQDAFEEIEVLDPSQREIDLTRAVRDTLLLAVPVRKVAPEAEDMDLTMVFGAPEPEDGLVIDPRWEALRALRDDKQADKS